MLKMGQADALSANVKNSKRRRNMKKLNLVISRKKWGRGKEDGRLLKDNGTMCCLGFAAKADGLKGLRRVGMPSNIRSIVNGTPPPANGFVERLLDEGHDDTKLCCELANTNDDMITTDSQKEKKITSLFAEKDIRVTFVP